MMSSTFFGRFARDESGAVTVDWVVLTAAVVSLVLLVFSVITRQSVSVGAMSVKNTLEASTQFSQSWSGPWNPAPGGDDDG
jgi:Flp pilus assembly pilin Flp